MYELGIRHAFNLPVVILAWKKQQLPFDIANQRIIMEDREMFSLETNITQIVEHIKSAESGAFYRPMDAVRRVAALDSAAKSVTTDTVLRDLVEEVASLKGTIGSSAAGRTGRVHRPNNSPKCDATAPHNNQAQIYHLLGSTERRKELMQQLEARGISKQQSGDFFSHMIPGGLVSCACTWGIESWVEYVASCIGGNISRP
jgi:hypothetical protein